MGIRSLRAGEPIDRSVLEAMNHSIHHRGPDSSGLHVEPGRVGLAMRRLSIIDVAGGDQPIANEDETIWIVYNGEVYNFRELRRDLEARGHHFRTATDTEVIVHAYEEFGDDCVTHLRGMFAFAIWDSRRERLLLARDRVGIKQLFFTQVGGQLLWASEIKALLEDPRVERRLRPDALNHYLAFSYTPEPATMFQGIEELRAGHVLVAEKGSIETRRYWQLEYAVDVGMSEHDAIDGMRAHLDDAIRARLVSDVPLGGFLSGGIDSGAVVAIMSQHSDAAVRTFSIGYARGGEAFDERVHARELAQRYGTEHHEFEMDPDVTEVLPQLIRAFDQPLGDSTAVPIWYLCELTRKHVTVALSGLGGDEIAAGYERHRGSVLAERLTWVPGWLRRGLLLPLAEALPEPRSGHQALPRVKRFLRTMQLPFDARYFGMLCQLSRSARSELLTPEMLEQVELDGPSQHFHRCVDPVASADPLNRALFADLKLFLPGNLLTLTDRVSMAHSLEVRVPFLDHQLLEFAARVPPQYKLAGREGKYVLRRAAADLLPESFFKRRKMGFSPPLAVWFREQLREFVEDSLSPSALAESGAFRPEAVRRILDDHFALRANYDNQIWALLMFVAWYRTYIGSGFERRPEGPQGARVVGGDGA